MKKILFILMLITITFNYSQEKDTGGDLADELIDLENNLNKGLEGIEGIITTINSTYNSLIAASEGIFNNNLKMERYIQRRDYIDDEYKRLSKRYIDLLMIEMKKPGVPFWIIQRRIELLNEMSQEILKNKTVILEDIDQFLNDLKASSERIKDAIERTKKANEEIKANIANITESIVNSTKNLVNIGNLIFGNDGLFGGDDNLNFSSVGNITSLLEDSDNVILSSIGQVASLATEVVSIFSGGGANNIQPVVDEIETTNEILKKNEKTRKEEKKIDDKKEEKQEAIEKYIQDKLDLIATIEIENQNIIRDYTIKQHADKLIEEAEIENDRNQLINEWLKEKIRIIQNIQYRRQRFQQNLGLAEITINDE